MAAEAGPGRLARAKVNLTLHLNGQRPDGYHLLDSLVVFPEMGDQLWVEPDLDLALSTFGPFGAEVPDDASNLIIKAANALADHYNVARGAAFRLEKYLPPASGIGGGSSDAATALGLLSELWGCEIPDGLALTLGADIPVCRAAPVPQRMRGIGEKLDPVRGLPSHWMVLVNPGVEVPTGAVFAEVEDRNPPPGPEAPSSGFCDFPQFAEWLKLQRNDLQAPAEAICPAIGEVLTALATAPVSRMSGSGATCFAVFEGEANAARMAAELRSRSGWWVAAAPVRTSD